jgi:hypothetical protein
MTRERTDATKAFYQAWVPNMTHIITFGRQLNKQQKKCKTIIGDKTLAHFTELFSLCKAYGDDRAANSGFESAAHVQDHSSACSIITANT